MVINIAISAASISYDHMGRIAAESFETFDKSNGYGSFRNKMKYDLLYDTGLKY